MEMSSESYLVEALESLILKLRWNSALGILTSEQSASVPGEAWKCGQKCCILSASFTYISQSILVSRPRVITVNSLP